MALKPSLREVLARIPELDGLTPDLEARATKAMEAHWRAGATSPWYVRALIGFSAWVAACFLIVFFALLTHFRDDAGLLILGLFLCAATTAVRRVSHHVFLSQLCLAFNITGQALVFFGLGELTEREASIAIGGLVINAILLFVYPDQVLRFLSAMAASVSLLVFVFQQHELALVDLALVGFAALLHFLFLHQVRFQQGPWRELVSPFAFALALVFFGALLARSFDDLGDILRNNSMHSPIAILTLGLASVTMYTAARILQETGLEVSGAAGVTVFASLGLTALLTLHTPGVIGAAGILALAFHRRSVVMLGMAVAFLITFGVFYYYDLSLSLLAKSLALLGSGLVLLGLRLFILRRFPATIPEAP